MTHDDYAAWDAPYVLGALSPAERREFEEHLRECVHCSEAVAELAGMPGLLGRVPRDQAFALLEPGPAEEQGVSADALPTLIAAARRRRRRNRWLTAGIAAAAAALLVGVAAFVLPSVTTPPAGPSQAVEMQQVEPSALTAELRLTPEPWGTRIDSRCTYARGEAQGYAPTWTYAMVVTDREGAETQISTWKAEEGSTVVPVATTSIPVSDIAAIDIRSAGDGRVLLRSTFG